jgi:competence protein ComEC
VWQIYSLALCAVLLLNPLNVLGISFWLSFGTVALIIYGMQGRLYPKGLWWQHGRVQWVIGAGLIPLSIALFQECSLISFFANGIAIPWMGFLILPFIFIGIFLLFFNIAIGKFFFILADYSLQILWQILTYFSNLSWGVWAHAILCPAVFLLAMLGMLLLFLPRGCKERGLGVILLLPLIFYQPLKPKRGEVWFTLLDVGQGLSAVVETTSHRLIFDAGPKLNMDFDMGESVVLPYLRKRDINKIDMLVVSHGDNDHIGGASAILNAIDVKFVVTSVPEYFTNHHAEYCFAGTHWRWDGVDFAFLYPTRAYLGLGNDSSCVLKISNAHHSILLTGDIEKFAENVLVATQWNELPTDILIAPHHGSKTSGIKAFLNQVNPSMVLFPVGYRNRYHFPHRKIVDTYKDMKVRMEDTVDNGAMQINMDKDIVMISYRKSHAHIWNA